MAEDKTYAEGTFCWMELGTTDSTAAQAYYTELFPWTYIEHPMPDGGVYKMAKVGDNQVAGLYDMPEEMTQANIPPHWMSYVAVEDADAMAAKVKELGGTVMKDPFDVMEMGRMAVCIDPAGAAFSLWQPAKHDGAGPKEFAPGYRCWNELLTRDVEKSATFFTALFGWEAEKKEMGGMPYTIFSLGEEQVGGMMPINPDMGEMPSCWIIYSSSMTSTPGWRRPPPPAARRWYRPWRCRTSAASPCCRIPTARCSGSWRRSRTDRICYALPVTGRADDDKKARSLRAL